MLVVLCFTSAFLQLGTSIDLDPFELGTCGTNVKMISTMQ